jgi:uncharacterized protein
VYVAVRLGQKFHIGKSEYVFRKEDAMPSLPRVSSILSGAAVFILALSSLPTGRAQILGLAVPLAAQARNDDPIGPGGFITPPPAPTPSSKRAAAQVCVPTNLVNNQLWDKPASGSKMAAFKSILRNYISAHGNGQVQYRIKENAFDNFNPAASNSPDPRAFLEEVSTQQACPGGNDAYTLAVNANASPSPAETNAEYPAVPQNARAQSTAQPPVANYPPDRTDPVAIRCDELADSPMDLQRVGNGVPYEQIPVGQALSVCQQAAARQPVRPRYQFLYGRVLDAARRYGEAAQQYAMADRAGCGLAAHNLAELYEYGEGVPKDYQKALDLLIRAGNAGFVDAFDEGGALYMEESPPNYAEARRWFEHAVQAGSVRAYVDLGFMYDAGQGVEKNPVKAAELYGEAARFGYPLGMYNLGQLYMEGSGVPRDDRLGYEWIYKAAQSGEPLAENDLAICYYLGRGTAKDHQAAFAWYLRAAQAGLAKAQTKVAFMYEQGDGVTQSDTEAVAWYRKAAAQNYRFAMTQLGIHLRLGEGVGWNEAEAMQWFKKAAGQGSVSAMTALGLGYKNGLGRDAGQGAQDYRQAAYWFGKAARQGDGFAQLNLGWLYEKGWGVNQDFDQARRLYAQAAANGDPRVAKLGREYFSDVAGSPTAAPSRTTISSAHDSSDFWAKVIVAGIAIAAVAALTSSDSSDSAGSSACCTSTDSGVTWPSSSSTRVSSPPSRSTPFYPNNISKAVNGDLTDPALGRR